MMNQLIPQNRTINQDEKDYTVIGVNAQTTEILFSREPSKTVAIILHGHVTYFLAGWGERSIELIVQTMLDITLWDGNIDSTQKVFHYVTNFRSFQNHTLNFLARRFSSILQSFSSI